MLDHQAALSSRIKAYQQARTPKASLRSKLFHGTFVFFEASEASAAGVYESTQLALWLGLASGSTYFFLSAAGGISVFAAVVECAKWKSRRKILADLDEKRVELKAAIENFKAEVEAQEDKKAAKQQEKFFSGIVKAITHSEEGPLIPLPIELANVKEFNLLLLSRLTAQCSEIEQRVKWDKRRLDAEVVIGITHGVVGSALLLVALLTTLNVLSSGGFLGIVVTIFLIVSVTNYTITLFFAIQKLWHAYKELVSAKKHIGELNDNGIGKDSPLYLQAKAQVEQCQARYYLRVAKLIRVIVQFIAVLLVGVGAIFSDMLGSAADTMIATGSVSNITVAGLWAGYQGTRATMKHRRLKSSGSNDEGENKGPIAANNDIQNEVASIAPP